MIEGDCIPIKSRTDWCQPRPTGMQRTVPAERSCRPPRLPAAPVPVLLVDVARRPGPAPGRNRGRLESLGNRVLAKDEVENGYVLTRSSCVGLRQPETTRVPVMYWWILQM
jgi:hypothetical protein